MSDIDGSLKSLNEKLDWIISRLNYLEREKLISITTSKVAVKEIEAKLRVEVEESKKELQTLVNGLTTKSLRLEEENKDLKRRIQITEEKLAELEKLILENIETT